MKRFVSFLVFLTLSLNIFSQQEIISAATEFIGRNKYDDANHYLDSILKRDSRNVDALMMKGNVVLNHAYMDLTPVYFISNNDESVFDTSEPAEKAKVLPKETVRVIEKYWRKCLRIDNGRTDILKGLCTLYSMALMKEELKKEITELLKVEKDEDGEQAFRLAEYARKFKELGRFDDAIEIYQFIAHVFPDLAGIRCDIASEFFYEGRLKDALRYLDSAMGKKNIDESTYLNAAFIYSELGYFDNAYKCFESYSVIYHAKMDVFYKGLMLFADVDSGYSLMLNTLISSIDSNSYYPEYILAKELLRFNDTFKIDNFNELIKTNPPEWYKPLIYQRAMKQFRNYCELFVQYGAFQSVIRNYSAGVQLLEEGENCKLDLEQKEKWALNYGYTLYMIGERKKAKQYFEWLYNSSDNFKQQSSQYFVAKILIEEKKNGEAKKLLEEIIQANVKTKYAAFSKYLLGQQK